MGPFSWPYRNSLDAENARIFLYSSPLLHCTENQIYVFPEKELRGLSPKAYIHFPVSDLYMYSQYLSTYLAAAKKTDRSWKYINLLQIYESRIELGDRTLQFCFGNNSFISGNT